MIWSWISTVRMLLVAISILLVSDLIQGQLQEVKSVTDHDDHQEDQHKLSTGLTTYECKGWSDIPTTIYLTSPDNPIGIILAELKLFRNCFP